MPVQLSQPSIFKQRLRNDEQPFESHFQPRLHSSPQQALLTSLKSLYSGARALIIVLEFEALLIDGHQVVFEVCFENTNKI